MKPSILFISESSPYPSRDGKRQRTLALVTAAQTNYNVDYLILGNKNDFDKVKSNNREGFDFFFLPNSPNSGFIKKLGLSFFPNPENRKQILQFLKDKNYEKILCRYASTGKDLPKIDNLIIDIDDDYNEVINSKIKSEKAWYRKARYWQIGKLNNIFYQRILKSARCLILVKPRQLAFSTKLLPNLPFQSILNVKKRSFSRPTSNSILFVGKLSYEPNSDGISWFLKEVWPLLLAVNDLFHLTIVSIIEPNENLSELIRLSMGVTLRINVEELESVYREHALCVVPIFFGGGTNVKLSEALYHYRRVISTPFGMRGFEKWENYGLVTTTITKSEWVNAIVSGLKMEHVESDFDEAMLDYSFEKWTKTLISILDEA